MSGKRGPRDSGNSSNVGRSSIWIVEAGGGGGENARRGERQGKNFPAVSRCRKKSAPSESEASSAPNPANFPPREKLPSLLTSFRKLHSFNADPLSAILGYVYIVAHSAWVYLCVPSNYICHRQQSRNFFKICRLPPPRKKKNKFRGKHIILCTFLRVAPKST